jgi:hypothetical protein
MNPPDFLTVEEAAEIVRIGRTAAYRLATLYLETGGAAGLPVVRYGRQLRVPRAKLEESLGGPITWPIRRAQPEPLELPTRPPVATSRRARRDDTPPSLFSA